MPEKLLSCNFDVSTGRNSRAFLRIEILYLNGFIFLVKPLLKKQVEIMVQISDRGDFLARHVEILVFANPSGYMFTSSGFSLFK